MEHLYEHACYVRHARGAHMVQIFSKSTHQ
jgi:hypothetical protein